MKILLTGSTGGIGSAIKDVLTDHEVITLDRGEVDFSLTEDVLSVRPRKVDWLIFSHGFIDTDKDENIEKTFAVNTLSVIQLTNRLLKYTSKGVIFISSTAGVNGNGGFPVYSASKSAVNCFAKSLSRKYSDKGFYSVCPGPTDTLMWKKLKLEGETQKPEEVAKVVQKIIKGYYQNGDIISVRNGLVSI